MRAMRHRLRPLGVTLVTTCPTCVLLPPPLPTLYVLAFHARPTSRVASLPSANLVYTLRTPPPPAPPAKFHPSAASSLPHSCLLSMLYKLVYLL